MESTKTAGRKAVIFAAAFMALVLAGCRNTEKNAEAVKEDAEIGRASCRERV